MGSTQRARNPDWVASFCVVLSAVRCAQGGRGMTSMSHVFKSFPAEVKQNAAHWKPLAQILRDGSTPSHALLLACLALCTSAPAAGELLRSTSSSISGLLAGFAPLSALGQHGTPPWHIPRRSRFEYVPATLLATYEADSGSEKGMYILQFIVHSG